MKTSALARIYALVMSALFASVATVGVAVMMSASGEGARTEFSVSVAAQQSPKQVTMERSRWYSQATDTARQSL